MPSPASSRELFATRPGFVLAAAGSAVGLGNMWRFPYQAAEGGGAAFVLLYVLMTFLIGVPIMASEFAIGRRTKRSPIGAYRAIGGTAWVPMGYLAVLTPLIILAYFSVIAGWTLRYAIDGLTGFSGSYAFRFAEVSSGMPAVAFHLILMIVTIAVVYRGIRKGIEQVSLILMPLLFILLVGLVVWVATLPGSGRGYEFYLQPSFSEILNPTVIKQAAAQAFLSLSVGMGIMITYSSYLDKKHDLGQEAVTVSMFDFSVAFIGGLVVFPIIFALGLSDQVGESTIGALFISIPAAIVEMGDPGRFVGIVFFVALLVAGLTSLISLLEVVVSSLMDGFAMRRGPSALVAGAIAAVAGMLPASSLSALGMMDKIASELFVVVGALGSLVLAGWVLRDPLDEVRTGASPLFAKILPGLVVTIRYLAPVFVAVILWLSVSDFVADVFQ
ncbi:MAG: sodium-dependent transporter [Woeseiaceae bacterium]